MPDKFTYVKKGYDVAEVDSYIDQLEEVIRNYKEKDSAIKNALVNAQIAADNIVKNAKCEADEIKRKAAMDLDFIYKSASKQKDLLKSFQTDYENMRDKYIKPLDEGDLLPVYQKVNDLEEYLLGLANRVATEQ